MASASEWWEKLGEAGLDARCCNCAGCGAELLSPRSAAWKAGLPAKLRWRVPQVVKARIDGRPFCADCLRLPTGRITGRLH